MALILCLGLASMTRRLLMIGSFSRPGALRHELSTTLGTLITALAAQGRHREALPYAQRQLQLDPLNEAAQRELLQLLAGSGQRAAALAQFAHIRQQLADELGVEPEAATLALVAQIRADAPTPSPSSNLVSAVNAARNGATAPAEELSIRNNLPRQLTVFLGRAAELAALEALLLDPAIRLVTILGPGGAGKTRLVLSPGGTAAGQVNLFSRRHLFRRPYGGDSGRRIAPGHSGCSGLRDPTPESCFRRASPGRLSPPAATLIGLG